MPAAAFLLLIAAAATVPVRPGPSQVAPGRGDTVAGDPVAALAAARAAVERAPSEFGPALLLARTLTALRRTDDALAAFARARQLAPDGSGVAAASAWLAPALLLRDLDRTGEAIRLLAEGAARRLGSADIHEQLALLHLADGQAEQALAVVSAAAARGLDSPGLDLVRGLALARSPALRLEALEILLGALEAGVGNPVVVHLEAADVLAAEGRYPEALDHVRAAGELAPEDLEAAYRRGRILAAAGDREGAAAALELFRSLQSVRDQAAETARSGSAEVASALAQAQRLAADGRLETALDGLDGVLESFPDHPRTPDVHSLRAKVLFSMGRVREAARSAAAARRHQPEQVEHHYLEGMFLHREGNAEEAAAALERALTLDPGLGEAHALLGTIAAEAGRSAEAAGHMERALELGLEGNAALRFNYSRVLETLGRSDEARAQMAAFERLRADGQP